MLNTTLIVLVPLIALIDVAAIVSIKKELNPGSKEEIIFLVISAIFYIGIAIFLFKRKDATKEKIAKVKKWINPK